MRDGRYAPEMTAFRCVRHALGVSASASGSVSCCRSLRPRARNNGRTPMPIPAPIASATDRMLFTRTRGARGVVPFAPENALVLRECFVRGDPRARCETDVPLVRLKTATRMVQPLGYRRDRAAWTWRAARYPRRACSGWQARGWQTSRTRAAGAAVPPEVSTRVATTHATTCRSC